jgi:IQ calmodulin-binding motif
MNTAPYNTHLSYLTPNITMEYSKSLNSNQVFNSGSIEREEYSEIRKKVQVVTLFVDKRKKAVLRIQKFWRGYSVRKNFLKIKYTVSSL